MHKISLREQLGYAGAIARARNDLGLQQKVKQENRKKQIPQLQVLCLNRAYDKCTLLEYWFHCKPFLYSTTYEIQILHNIWKISTPLQFVEGPKVNSIELAVRFVLFKSLMRHTPELQVALCRCTINTTDSRQMFVPVVLPYRWEFCRNLHLFEAAKLLFATNLNMWQFSTANIQVL